MQLHYENKHFNNSQITQISVWSPKSASSMVFPIHNTPARGSLFLWAVKCFCMWAFCLNPFPQTGQPNGLSPEWTLMCWLRLCLVANCFPQIGHPIGREASMLSTSKTILVFIFSILFLLPDQACNQGNLSILNFHSSFERRFSQRYLHQLDMHLTLENLLCKILFYDLPISKLFYHWFSCAALMCLYMLELWENVFLQNWQLNGFVPEWVLRWT